MASHSGNDSNANDNENNISFLSSWNEVTGSENTETVTLAQLQRTILGLVEHIGKLDSQHQAALVKMEADGATQRQLLVTEV